MLSQLYEKFQHWSDGGSVWIYSDTHFDDSDCISMNPHWPTPASQIDTINSLVKPMDTFILLGDVGNPTYIQHIRARYKVLITGNHDLGASNYAPYFNEIYTGPLFVGEKILLSHEPIELGFGLNIHGHTHDRLGYGFHDLNHFNVCANSVDFKPINLKGIITGGYLKRVESIHHITINRASCII